MNSINTDMETVDIEVDTEMETVDMFRNDPAHFVKLKHITPEIRSLILELGPCQPLSNDLPGKSFPKNGSKENRSFKEIYYYRILPDKTKCLRDWLSYSPSKNKIYCMHCFLFGTNLHKNLEKSWTKNGFDSWKNLSSGIEYHELTNDHINATLKYKLRKTSTPILPSLEYQRKIEVSMNRQVINEIIDIVLYLARHNLAFRGHRDNWSVSSPGGNFKDLVILLAKSSAPLSDHLNSIKLKKKGQISFVTWERQNQLIDSISHDISSQIQQAVVQSNMFSISIDSTFDASRREQVSFVIRYVDDTFGLIHERVIAIKESPITTGKDLYSLFVAIMEKEKLNWKDCLVGQSYDGASNMRGNYKGLQAHIKRECPQALYVWCHAHRLALVVKQAVSCDSNSRDLFGNLESLYVLLWCSKKRAATFREAQKKHSDLKYTQEHAVKRVCTTRWNSHSAALNVVIKFHHAVLQTLEEIKNLEGVTDATVGANCSGLIDYFTSRRFLLTAFTFKKLFDILEVVTRQFQTHDMDILLATSIVTKTINSIRKLRANNSFEEIIKLTDNFINESDTDFIPLKNIRPRRVPIKAGMILFISILQCYVIN